jgi:Mn-dependent DtxR family transcriptional regulator
MDRENEEFLTARGYEIAAGEDSLTPSMEDYIEMIYRLSSKTGYTRVNDLAEHLNVQPPSVTKMMQKLHEKSLLKYEKYGMIHLTEEGTKLGKFFLKRHDTLKELLKLLGAKENLLKDVEQIEHYISWDTFEGMYALVKFFNSNESALREFEKYKGSITFE